MESIDPVTGRPLPPDAIQRVLFIAPAVHVYNIPPLASTKGYTAATWTEDPRRHIFTARLRVIETAIPPPEGDAATTANTDAANDKVKTDVVLEDPASGQLFAAAPYADAAAVEPALDSSRFFALRVQDGAGRRAVLGIGFEERPEAFDFSVALQEARKALDARPGGGDQGQQQNQQGGGKKKKKGEWDAPDEEEEKRDYSLKEGETITVSFGGGSRFGKRISRDQPLGSGSGSGFSLPPPPGPSSSASSGSRAGSGGGGGGGFSLPPPPGPSSASAGSRGSGSSSPFSLPPPPPSSSSSASGASSGGLQRTKKSAAELGFDDGQFGEFA